MALNKAAVLSELLAQFLFVFICTGAATGIAGVDGWVQEISMTFGMCITVLAYTIGGRSGGHINGAVTVGLTAAGLCEPVQAVANIGAQLLGSVIASGVLSALVHNDADRTGGLGANGIGADTSPVKCFIGEIVMTFVLMYVVLETACNKANAGNGVMAPVAIGFAVYLGHVVLIPMDGCSINPTRSFGPAVVAAVQGRHASRQFHPELEGQDISPPSRFKDFWVFVLGPVGGALLAVAYYTLVNKVAETDTADDETVDVEDVELGDRSAPADVADATAAFAKTASFAAQLASESEAADPCEGLANAKQLELFVDHSKRVVEQIEHQAKAHEAKVLTASAKKKLVKLHAEDEADEVKPTTVTEPGGDE